MQIAACETCAVRVPGAICDVSRQAEDDFRAVATNIRLKPHQMVFAEGTPSTGLYLVCHGSVKLYQSHHLGRDHILEIVGPGEVLGEFGIGQVRPFSASAKTLEETHLAFIPRARLEWFLRLYPDTAIRLIDALNRDLARARRKARDLALEGAETRLASLLLQWVGSGNGHPLDARIRLRYGRQEIAEMIGVSTETAIRLLAGLKAKGIITIRRRDIAIRDVVWLRRIASSDKGGV